MKKHIKKLLLFSLVASGALALGSPATDNSAPHLETRHGVRQPELPARLRLAE
jgi:hypothetical protein